MRDEEEKHRVKGRRGSVLIRVRTREPNVQTHSDKHALRLRNLEAVLRYNRTNAD